MTKDEVLNTLRALVNLSPALWLAGGVGADFHVGQWTRDHDDIDLVAFEDDRVALSQELLNLGFIMTNDRGWITRWSRTGLDVGDVSLAYMRRVAPDTGDMVIRPEYEKQGLVSGIYPGFPGNLDPERFGSIDDVRFRVVSAQDEWLFAKGYTSFKPGAQSRATVVHNLSLLETVLSDDELEQLRPLVGRRLPLPIE